MNPQNNTGSPTDSSDESDLVKNNSRVDYYHYHTSPNAQSPVKIVKLRAQYFLTLMKQQKQTKNNIDLINKEIQSLRQRVRKCEKSVKKRKRNKHEIQRVIEEHYMRNQPKSQRDKIGKIRLVSPSNIVQSKIVQEKSHKPKLLHTFGKKIQKQSNNSEVSQGSSTTSIKLRHPGMQQSLEKIKANNKYNKVRNISQQRQILQRRANNYNHQQKSKHRHKNRRRKHTHSNQVDSEYYKYKDEDEDQVIRLEQLRKDFQKIIDQQNSYSLSFKKYDNRDIKLSPKIYYSINNKDYDQEGRNNLGSDTQSFSNKKKKKKYRTKQKDSRHNKYIKINQPKNLYFVKN